MLCCCWQCVLFVCGMFGKRAGVQYKSSGPGGEVHPVFSVSSAALLLPALIKTMVSLLKNILSDLTITFFFFINHKFFSLHFVF